MTTPSSRFSTDGFEPAATAIIEMRRVLVRSFAEKTLGDQPLSVTTDDASIRRSFHTIVVGVQNQRYQRSAPQAVMSELDFLPLAQALDLPQNIRRQRIKQFWRVGALHPSFGRPNGQDERDAELFQHVEQRVLNVLESSLHETVWYEQFVERNLCRDKEAADRIARALDNINVVSASQAMQIASSWCCYGNLGLLTSTDYSYITELLRIEQHHETLDITPEKWQTLVALLRADVVSVLQMLESEELRKQRHKQSATASAFVDQSILHQPAYTRARQEFRERLEPVRAVCIDELSVQRHVSGEEAEALFRAVVDNGLAGIITWRLSTLNEKSTDTYALRRLEKTIAPLLAWMPSEAQSVVYERLRLLVRVASEEQMPISFTRLVKDMPSSRYRRRLQQRRLSNKFFARVAESGGISIKAAHGIFKNFVVYGLIGLVEQRDWSTLIHPQLWHYLWMFKFGRVEDTVDTGVLAHVVNRYARQLNVPELPHQAVRAIYSHFPKDGYYNSGDGLATAGVPLRRSLKLAGVDRLHERWIIVPVELSIELVDTALRPIGDESTALLVFDSGTSCVVDCWLTGSEPDATAYKLAFYNALFHPAALTWPLRGIPERLLLPSLAADDSALLQATTYLMTTIDRIDNLQLELKARKVIRTHIQELQRHFQPPMIKNRRGPKQRLTLVQAEKAIRDWLYIHCFPDHRVKLAPLALRKFGVALPGFDTPTAGWLLPIICTTSTVRDGIQLGNLVYGSDDSGIEPGVEVQVRSAPPRLGRTRGVFIEYKSGLLQYLPLLPK